MRKVFIDVGGFEGESSRAALDPLFGFDAVYCFEPVAACCDRMGKAITSKRFHLMHSGLFDTTTTCTVYSIGSPGASIYADAPEDSAHTGTAECVFIRSSEFFRDNVGADDRVWMKLNCEGAEVAILNDLLDSGEAIKLQEVLIDFDAAKIPSMRGSVERLEARLASAPFTYHYPPEVQYGMITNFGSIRNWLLASGAADQGPMVRVSSAIYQIPYLCDARFNGYYKIRLLRWLGLRPPPNQVPIELRHTWSRVDQPRGPYHGQ
jgi:FkbM family methyltransferase